MEEIDERDWLGRKYPHANICKKGQKMDNQQILDITESGDDFRLEDIRKLMTDKFTSIVMTEKQAEHYYWLLAPPDLELKFRGVPCQIKQS